MQSAQYSGWQVETALVWFRRDLRTYDNPALVAALQAAKNVIPVFIWAPEEEGQFQPGRQTRWWIKTSIALFAQQLERMGGRLIVRRAADSVAALHELIEETGAQGVFFNHLYDSISMVRDNDVKDKLRRRGVACTSFNADVLYEPWEVLEGDGTPFTTFKGFWDKVLGMGHPPALPLPEPLALPSLDPRLASLSVGQVDWFMTPEQEASTDALQHRWRPGTEGAHARLEQFLGKALPLFAHERAKTDRESTTMLSPWVHMGSISVRFIYYRVAQVHASHLAGGADISRSCLDFLQQMGYREYSRYLSFHFPFITERSMLAHLRACPFRRDAGAFKAWRQGLTGYPLIDAGMRQLWATGWCHNRVRVVAASFLVKNLLLPWQWGLKHLWDCQIDADLECDALGWQYVAGCLADAHPFNVMIDLEREWERFDPQAEYVRRWLPVLARLPPEWAHQPWRAPAHVLEAAGVELGLNYPRPLVSMETAQHGVMRAWNIIERCTTSSSSGAGGDSSSGHSTGSVLPRKEPYRPATDPAVLAGILGAAAEGFDVWELQQRLPGLELREPGRSASPWTGSSGSAPRRQRQRMLAAPEHSYGDAAGSDNEASLSAAMDADGSDSQEEASFSCGSSGSGNDMLRRSGGGGAARPAYSDTSIGTMSTDASALRPWEEGRDGWPRMQQPAATGQQVLAQDGEEAQAAAKARQRRAGSVGST